MGRRREVMGKTRCEEWKLRRLPRRIRSVLLFWVVPLIDCTMGINHDLFIRSEINPPVVAVTFDIHFTTSGLSRRDGLGVHFNQLNYASAPYLCCQNCKEMLLREIESSAFSGASNNRSAIVLLIQSSFYPLPSTNGEGRAIKETNGSSIGVKAPVVEGIVLSEFLDLEVQWSAREETLMDYQCIIKHSESRMNHCLDDMRILTQTSFVGAANLSLDSNPIVNNIGPDNTNRCDAAATIEGCSEVSKPIPPQTVPLILITPTMETMKLAKSFPIPFPVPKYLQFTE
ncbi:hypothetical protein HID58_028452 [Brassica napus]|uniref:Uncharacterized protein n=1 Tax=Brassica napus TaxID=3708 RepID=A0ABQ8CAB1_BRANA|nr:hypothetical protein HID58_028452 [Brassica napus]